MPENFTSIRPVLRINAEIRREDDGNCREKKESVYLEFNTAVEAYGKRGWLNVGHWDSEFGDLSYERNGKAVTFSLPFLTITYTGIGIEGSCPRRQHWENTACVPDRAEGAV